MTPNDAYIQALKAERLGYVNRGLTARVALVDAELARLGVKVRPERKAAAAADAVETGDEAPASPVETASARPRRRK